MAKAFLSILILTLFSCSNQELENLKVENEKLRQVIDSLNSRPNRDNFIPFIDYRDFQGTLGENLNIHFLAVKKGGYEVDSIEIKGFSKTQTTAICNINNDPFGAFITFFPDTAGIYDFKAYTRLSENNHTVKQSFLVEIKKAPSNR